MATRSCLIGLGLLNVVCSEFEYMADIEIEIGTQTTQTTQITQTTQTTQITQTTQTTQTSQS